MNVGYLVDIHTQPGRRTFPDLSEILAAIGGQGADLTWFIWNLRVLSTDATSSDVSRLEADSRKIPTGIELTWAELNLFAGSVVQVEAGILFGVRSRVQLPSRDSDADWYDGPEIVVEAWDTTIWRVFATRQSVIDCLMGVFTDVRLIPLEEGSLH